MSADTRAPVETDRTNRRAEPYRTAFEARLSFRDASERAREQLRAWLQSKNYDIERFDAGDTGLARGVVIWHAATNEVCGWQLRESREHGLTWVSTISVARERHPSRTWISLNVEALGSGSVPPPPAATPKLARLLLACVDAFDGDADLRERPTTVNAARVDDLLDTVCSEDRRLPVVVAAAPADVAFEHWRGVVERLFHFLPGLASTYLLDPVAATAFNEGIGPTHWIGPGSVRTYLPGVDPAISEDSVRHRILSRRRIEAEPSRASRVLSALPRQLAAAALPSAATRGLNLSLRSRQTSQDSEDKYAALRKDVELLDDLLAAADDVEQSLREAVSNQQEEILDLAGELEILRGDLERRDALVRALQGRLVGAKLFDDAYLPAVEPPPLPTSFAELLDRLEQLEPWVRFTGDAGICLDLDERLQSSAWAQAGWKGLLALSDYAEASAQQRFPGDFKMWCETPPDSAHHTISAGKVARDESASVRRNRKFSTARTFRIPKSVDAAERIFMGAHIRLGNSTTVAPRMHFHDASRNDGTVYVGYIGPHLPNTLTS